jgi:multidrug efflux pump subunit AcrA (membrane-fusion protein)
VTLSEFMQATQQRAKALMWHLGERATAVQAQLEVQTQQVVQQQQQLKSTAARLEQAKAEEAQKAHQACRSLADCVKLAPHCSSVADDVCAVPLWKCSSADTADG